MICGDCGSEFEPGNLCVQCQMDRANRRRLASMGPVAVGEILPTVLERIDEAHSTEGTQ